MTREVDGWKNHPTKWWADRLAAPRWRDQVVAAARVARTLEGFRQANLEALAPGAEDGLYEWAEHWVDWPALWRHFKGGGQRADSRPQAFKKRDVA
jgi:hypothetical protein